MATSLDGIDSKTFESSQKFLLGSAGSVQVTARRHWAQAEGKEGREVNSSRTYRTLRAMVRKADFILWLMGAMEASKQGRVIFDVFTRSLLHLLCAYGTVGRRG